MIKMFSLINHNRSLSKEKYHSKQKRHQKTWKNEVKSR
jgi:hypothetical protein